MPASGDSVLIDFGCQPQTEIPISDVSCGFIETLNWLAESGTDFKAAGVKAAALAVLLRGTGKYPSLGAVVADAGISRAVLRDWLLQLEASGIRLPKWDSHFTAKNSTGASAPSTPMKTSLTSAFCYFFRPFFVG
jgi:hypothetical protein